MGGVQAVDDVFQLLDQGLAFGLDPAGLSDNFPVLPLQFGKPGFQFGVGAAARVWRQPAISNSTPARRPSRDRWAEFSSVSFATMA